MGIMKKASGVIKRAGLLTAVVAVLAISGARDAAAACPCCGAVNVPNNTREVQEGNGILNEQTTLLQEILEELRQLHVAQGREGSMRADLQGVAGIGDWADFAKNPEEVLFKSALGGQSLLVERSLPESVFANMRARGSDVAPSFSDVDSPEAALAFATKNLMPKKGDKKRDLSVLADRRRAELEAANLMRWSVGMNQLSAARGAPDRFKTLLSAAENATNQREQDLWVTTTLLAQSEMLQNVVMMMAAEMRASSAERWANEGSLSRWDAIDAKKRGTKGP